MMILNNKQLNKINAFNELCARSMKNGLISSGLSHRHFKLIVPKFIKLMTKICQSAHIELVDNDPHILKMATMVSSKVFTYNDINKILMFTTKYQLENIQRVMVVKWIDCGFTIAINNVLPVIRTMLGIMA